MRKAVIILIALLGAVSCQSVDKNLAKSNSCSEQNIARLTGVLDSWLAAIDSGPMDKFRKLSMAPTLKYLDEELGVDPDPDEEIAFVQDIGRDYSEYKDYDFLQCRCGQERVRLDYKKISPDQTAGFLSIMFHREGGRWKVGSALKAAGYPISKDNGEAYTIDDFPGDSRFLIK